MFITLTLTPDGTLRKFFTPERIFHVAASGADFYLRACACAANPCKTSASGRRRAGRPRARAPSWNGACYWCGGDRAKDCLRPLKLERIVSFSPEGQHETLAQINILYVEDYELVLFTVKQLLELEGWAVEVCRDGATALKNLESGRRFDIIVLDAEMMGVHGLEVLRRLRSMTHRRRTPVIMFTATECESEAFNAGADAFLKKPSGIRELIPTVERLLGADSADLDLNGQQSSHGRS